MAAMTSISPQVRPTELTAEEIFERAKSRELRLSRLLMFYISGGLPRYAAQGPSETFSYKHL
jgi:hypothetical protein